MEGGLAAGGVKFSFGGRGVGKEYGQIRVVLHWPPCAGTVSSLGLHFAHGGHDLPPEVFYFESQVFSFQLLQHQFQTWKEG